MIGLPPGDAYVIRIDGGGLGVSTDLTVVITRRRDRNGDYWTADEKGETRKIREVQRFDRTTDSRTCAALGKVAAELPKLPKDAKPQPAFDVPFTLISVRTKGQLRPIYPGDYLGPIARWAWRALTDLEPCWRDVAPSQAAADSP